MTRVSAMIRPPLFIGSAVAVKCPQSRQLVSPVIMRVSSMSSHPEKQRRLSPRTLKLAIDLPQVRILCHLIFPLRHFDHILTITVNRERKRWWSKGASSCATRPSAGSALAARKRVKTAGANLLLERVSQDAPVHTNVTVASRLTTNDAQIQCK